MQLASGLGEFMEPMEPMTLMTLVMVVMLKKMVEISEAMMTPELISGLGPKSQLRSARFTTA
jgi:hypothetical protein